MGGGLHLVSDAFPALAEMRYLDRRAGWTMIAERTDSGSIDGRPSAMSMVPTDADWMPTEPHR